MTELRFARISEDGRHLVLTGDSGEEFSVALSDELRTAVRRPPRVASQLPELAAPATVKDVQAMLRAGGTVQEVAERTGWEAARVERYEPPVRAERDYVTSLVRNLPTDADTTFGERVAERLAGRDVDGDELVWDSYRSTATNAWTVVCSFPAGGRDRQAQWTFEPADRRAVPINDESRWLSEEDSPGGLIPQAPVVAPYDVIADGGLDRQAAPRPKRASRAAVPFGRSTEQPATADPAAVEPESIAPEPAVTESDITAVDVAAPEAADDGEGPVDLMSAIRRRSTSRRRKDPRPKPAAQSEPVALETVALDTETGDDGGEVDPVTGTVDLFTQVDDPTPPEQVLTAALAEDDFADAELYDADDVADETAEVEYEPEGDAVIDDAEGQEPSVPSRPSQARSGRPSVPSWDDIMFGRRARD